jgi:hypothetical protein
MLLLLCREQVIEQTQIHRVDRHLGQRGRGFVLHPVLNRDGSDGLPLGEQLTQRRRHRRLALLRCQVQDAQVFLGRRPCVLGFQDIMGNAKHARRKQLLAVAVLGERPRLPHQPVDHVPIVDAVLVSAPQARQPFDQLLGIPDFHVLGIQPGLDLLADQPTRHRVAVPLHVDQAALVHATALSLACFQPPRR